MAPRLCTTKSKIRHTAKGGLSDTQPHSQLEAAPGGRPVHPKLQKYYSYQFVSLVAA